MKANRIHATSFIKEYNVSGWVDADTNNCVLNAVTVCERGDYEEVYKEFQKLGRRSGRGVLTSVVMKYFNSKRDSWKRLDRDEITKVYVNSGVDVVRKMTVNTFARQNSKGRFFLLVRGHAVAVVDGEIYDNWNSGNRRIMWGWEFVGDRD